MTRKTLTAKHQCIPKWTGTRTKSMAKISTCKTVKKKIYISIMIPEQENKIFDWCLTSYTVTTVGIDLCTAIYIVQGITTQQNRHNTDLPTRKPTRKPTLKRQHSLKGIQWHWPNQVNFGSKFQFTALFNKMRFSLPSIKCSGAPPSWRILPSTVSLSKLCTTIGLPRARQ